MLPPTNPKQDVWTFLWREGQVLHIQVWDRSIVYSRESDNYLGNVSFPLHIQKVGPQRVEGSLHHGPPGQMRSKAKVTGSITIEWDWKSRTDILRIDFWVPLLQDLVHGDDRVLSFLRQEDLLPHVSLPVAQFILGQISKGYVILPHTSPPQVSRDLSTKKQPMIVSTDADWEFEFADENENENEGEMRGEPDGLIFIDCDSKIFSVDFWDGETIEDLEMRIRSCVGVGHDFGV